MKVNPYSYRVGKGTQSDGNVSVSVMVSTLYRMDINMFDNKDKYSVRVITIDGIEQETLLAETMDEGYHLFDQLSALYIDTEGGSYDEGYVVSLIDPQGNVVVEDTQSNYKLW